MDRICQASWATLADGVRMGMLRLVGDNSSLVAKMLQKEMVRTSVMLCKNDSTLLDCFKLLPCSGETYFYVLLMIVCVHIDRIQVQVLWPRHVRASWPSSR